MPDGVRVWYKLAGRDSAPVVAYLHGGPGYNAYAFEKSAGRLLEESFRVLYIDQRGCGRSGFEGPNDAYGMEKTVEDVEHLRLEIGAQGLGLIGHSFGGVVAAAYAHRYPKSVSAMVMVDTAPSVGQAIAHQVEVVDGIADTAFPAKAALDSDSAVMGCTSGRTVAAYEREGYLGNVPPDVTERLAVPSLLLAGRSSEVIGKENLENAARAWGAEMRWFDEAGHFLYFEKPREFAESVARFFATTLAAPWAVGVEPPGRP